MDNPSSSDSAENSSGTSSSEGQVNKCNLTLNCDNIKSFDRRHRHQRQMIMKELQKKSSRHEQQL